MFSSVPGLKALKLCASGELTVSVSVELNGAPAGFRIWIDRRQLMHPGRVRFVPAGAHDSFSFTFVRQFRPIRGLDRHILRLQWRSPFGIDSSLERSVVDAHYAPANC